MSAFVRCKGIFSDAFIGRWSTPDLVTCHSCSRHPTTSKRQQVAFLRAAHSKEHGVASKLFNKQYFVLGPCGRETADSGIADGPDTERIKDDGQRMGREDLAGEMHQGLLTPLGHSKGYDRDDPSWK